MNSIFSIQHLVASSLYDALRQSFFPLAKTRIIFTDDQKDSNTEHAFKYAIHRINRDKILLPNITLLYEVQYITSDDTFHTTKKACKLIQSGLVALFGPSNPLLASHIQSVCNALDIPHIEARLDMKVNDREFSINLYPSYELLGQAYQDVIQYLNWRKLALIYEDDFGFIKMQHLLRSSYNIDVLIRHATPSTYRTVLKTIRGKGYNNIFVDTHKENMDLFLRTILQLQMNDYSYHYFFTSFDADTFDLEDFKYNFVNMTAFRIVDFEHPLVRQILGDMEKFQPKGHQIVNKMSVIETEPALIYDAVHVFARGLHNLEQGSTLRIANVTCEDEIQWNDGISLYNYINAVEFHGLTGKIQFKEGKRTNFKLDVIKLKQNAIDKVGEWTPTGGINVTEPGAFYDGSVPNVTLIVTTIEEIPYVMVKKDNITGNERFDGFCIDLLKVISSIVGFKYRIELVPDGKYGAPDKETGEWSGIVRQLLDKRADLSVAALTINYARESVIDFSKPFLNLGIGILFKAPTGQPMQLFSFMNPLAIEIWLYVLCAYMLVSLTMFIVARFSPYEWNNPHPCLSEPDYFENNFSISNSFWFTIGTLMQQGSDLNPKATSTRIVGGIWWFFTLIIISSYTANLAAFLTVERMISPIENADDLVEQNEIAYGTLEQGSTMTFFRESKMDTYQKMWRYMESRKPSVFVSSYEDGIKKVLDGNYAFLMESTTIDYFVQRNCNLTKIGGTLDSKGFGIATPIGSPWRDKISLAILDLQEKGTVQMLYNKWWKNTGETCHREEKSKESKASALGLNNIGGVFVVLLSGLALAIVIAILEFCWNSKKNAQTDRQSLCSEMAEELRFALQCRGSKQRPALRRQLPHENGIMQMINKSSSAMHFESCDS
uniref:Glutamate receptor ionotropic, kainate 2 n=1 Tax=Strigamia maritima TaxID=126957 RepID=T1JJ21_STRMM